MRVFKARYTDRDGLRQKSQKWYIDFVDHCQIRRRLPALSDKRASEGFGRNIENLVACRIAGIEPDTKINQWLETIPLDTLEKFALWGLIDGRRTEFARPLKDHIDDYVKILESKGLSSDYVTRSKNRLLRAIEDCRFVYFRDVTKSQVEIYLGKLKDGKTDTTRGHYLDCLKTFLAWAKQDGRILSNPLADIEKPARDSEQKGVLTPEQFITLIRHTFEKNILLKDRTGKTTTGQERAAMYLLAGTTGLRRNELLLLTWDCITLAGENSFVRVRAAIAKNGKEALQPIPPATVGILAALKAAIRPSGGDNVFGGFGKTINTAELIRADLEAAKLPLKDREGNKICFHSLRNSYISFLANSQAPAKVVQKLARHSDPRLTFNTYARAFENTEQTAIKCLPNLGNFVFANCFAKPCENQRTLTNSSGGKAWQDTAKNAVFKSETIPPRGVEPLSHG